MAHITWNGKHGTAEASDLGWTPGYFRGKMIVRCPDDPDGRATTVQFFDTQRNSEGEIVSWKYTSPEGVTVIVFND